MVIYSISMKILNNLTMSCKNSILSLSLKNLVRREKTDMTTHSQYQNPIINPKQILRTVRMQLALRSMD